MTSTDIPVRIRPAGHPPAPALVDPAAAAVSAVSLRGITKDFGSAAAVRGIDLELAQGEIVALLGPNGAGKTTTIDLILGLTQATTGEVSVLGFRPRQAIARGLVSYADRIVLISQGRIMADGTGAEIRALTTGRSVRALLPDADVAAIAGLDGVESVDVRGDTVLIDTRDSDEVARYLLTRTRARDLEITAKGLEDAFLSLTRNATDQETSR